MKSVLSILVIILTLMSALPKTYAEPEIQNSIQFSLHNAMKGISKGPAKIPLIDQATIDVPKGFVFIPATKAEPFMHQLQNPVDNDLIGLIMPQVDKDFLSWFVAVHFKKDGYVPTQELAVMHPAALLDQIQKKVDVVNLERGQAGLEPIHITEWHQSPQYDTEAHRLTWSLLHTLQGEKDAVVNQEIFILGREGAFELSLVAYAPEIAKDEAYLRTILSSLNFNPGKRYEDYVSGDKIANKNLQSFVTGELPVTKSLADTLFDANMWQRLLGIAIILALVCMRTQIVQFFAYLIEGSKKDEISEQE